MPIGVSAKAVCVEVPLLPLLCGDDSVSLQRLSALTALPRCLRLGVSEKVVLPRIALCAANSHRCPCTSSEKTSNRILLHWKTNASPALALLFQPPACSAPGICPAQSPEKCSRAPWQQQPRRPRRLRQSACSRSRSCLYELPSPSLRSCVPDGTDCLLRPKALDGSRERIVYETANEKNTCCQAC